ncbi:MAG: 6-carboxytetrahydropterin synthase [Gemmatimonadota bacterium]|nr:6-carboxytetrahydropterin synthase [Gemmatimonadota bacterium]MDH5804403.1 6-carboxytetrahydropterin synthase [Gemmatimonadota bacterium]
MGHYLISAETGFSAAHILPGVELCSRLHGHNWNVRLTVKVDESDLDDGGMGIDFRIVEDTVKSAIEPFDHKYLNDLPEFAEHAPTAERVAKVVCDTAVAQMPSHISVEQIDVWETPEFRVVYRP